MTADGTQHLRAEAHFVFTEQGEDRRHAADASADLSEKFGLCARAEGVQVLGAALEAKPVERVEVDHVRAFQPGVATPRGVR
jgi:hypothetical protein